MYLESVTASSIDIENIPSVTTSPTVETPIEPTPEPQPEPKGRMGWVSRWGQWIRASFLAATNGAQYRMLIQELGEWSEVLAWPHQIRWEDPTLENPAQKLVIPRFQCFVYARFVHLFLCISTYRCILGVEVCSEWGVISYV